MSSFFSSIATKAQSAYEQSPLSSQVSQLQTKLQSHHGASSENPQAEQAPAQGGTGARSQVLGNITHQFRHLQMQYANVSPAQRIITAEKGVVLDVENIAKDAKSQSKELFMWGQNQDEDLRDVTDRLAYLNFIHGALAATLASQLDASRSFFKALRNAEKALEPRRNSRASLQTQIGRLEHDMSKGWEKKIADLREQLTKLEAEDESAEKEVEVLKRKAVRESERDKWAAIREYGEKLVLLAEASTPIISALPSVPPSESQPYTGAESTAATRASLQHALDNFKPGSISHSFQSSAADLDRSDSDSRGFGVTHASELSRIESPSLLNSGRPETPFPEGSASQPSQLHSSSPPPVNPAALNNAPAPIPSKPSPTSNNDVTPFASSVAAAPSTVSGTSIYPSDAKSAPLQTQPTIAETGVPVSAGSVGPGPASGSLKDVKSDVPAPSSETEATGALPATGATPKFDTAEGEKARLQQEERERLEKAATPSAAPPATPPTGPAQKYESAEEEKKRLEKEEKERLLKEEQAKEGDSGHKGGDGGTPPPYQAF